MKERPRTWPIGLTAYEIAIMIKLLNSSQLRGYELQSANRVKDKLLKTQVWIEQNSD